MSQAVFDGVAWLADTHKAKDVCCMFRAEAAWRPVRQCRHMQLEEPRIHYVFAFELIKPFTVNTSVPHPVRVVGHRSRNCDVQCC